MMNRKGSARYKMHSGFKIEDNVFSIPFHKLRFTIKPLLCGFISVSLV